MEFLCSFLRVQNVNVQPLNTTTTGECVFISNCVQTAVGFFRAHLTYGGALISPRGELDYKKRTLTAVVIEPTQQKGMFLVDLTAPAWDQHQLSGIMFEYLLRSAVVTQSKETRALIERCVFVLKGPTSIEFVLHIDQTRLVVNDLTKMTDKFQTLCEDKAGPALNEFSQQCNAVLKKLVARVPRKGQSDSDCVTLVHFNGSTYLKTTNSVLDCFKGGGESKVLRANVVPLRDVWHSMSEVLQLDPSGNDVYGPYTRSKIFEPSSEVGGTSLFLLLRDGQVVKF